MPYPGRACQTLVSRVGNPAGVTENCSGTERNYDILVTRSLQRDAVSVRVKRHRGKKHKEGKTEFSPNAQVSLARAIFPLPGFITSTDPARPLGRYLLTLCVSPSSQSGAFKRFFRIFFLTWWGHVGSCHKNDIVMCGSGWWVDSSPGTVLGWCKQYMGGDGWAWLTPLCFKPAPPWWSRGPRFYPGNLY